MTEARTTRLAWALWLLTWQIAVDVLRTAAVVTTIVLVARWFKVLWL